MTTNSKSPIRRLAADLAEGWNDYRHAQRRQAELNLPWSAAVHGRKSHQR
jgi:hypothetical protein